MYTYYRTVTIDNTKVPGDLTDHPFLFNTTHNDLRTIINGGHVTSLSGYDIVFSANIDGSSPYAHEIEKYDPVTGQFVAHVKISAISSTVPTVFYIVYGDSGVTTSQEDIVGVWDNDFKMVQHFHGANVAALDDSTSLNNDVVASVGDPAYRQTGVAGYCVILDGNDSFSLNNAGSLSPEANDFTVEAWIRTTTDPGAAYSYLWVDYNGTARVALAFYDNLYTRGYFRDSGGDEAAAGANALNFDDDVWHHLLMTRVGTTVNSYWDGALQNDYQLIDPDLGAITVNGGAAPEIGRLNVTGSYYTGSIDEMRISKGLARSLDYTTTTYNNIFSPGTFYALGAEQGSPIRIPRAGVSYSSCLGVV